MKRYLIIYCSLLKLNFSNLLAYRVNLVNSAFSSTLWATLNIVSTYLLTSRTSTVFGWKREELLLLAGVYNVFFGLFYLFFSRNFGELVRIIHMGQLDGILVRPLDSQFSLTGWFVSYTSLVRVCIGALFSMYMLYLLHISLSLRLVVLFFCFLIFGLIIMYSLWFIILTVTIWFTNLSNLVDFLYSVNSVTRYPQEMFRGFSQILFFILFPLTLVIVTPVKELLHKAVLFDVISIVVVAIAMFVFSRFFWKYALRFYTSASG